MRCVDNISITVYICKHYYNFMEEEEMHHWNKMNITSHQKITENVSSVLVWVLEHAYKMKGCKAINSE